MVRRAEIVYAFIFILEKEFLVGVAR